MDEIRELQRQLAAVQLEDTVHKLSERNCVEILLKLQATGLLELIYTQSGKEFLTPQQLRNEVEDELLTHGGRVSTAEIQPVLGVDPAHVEATAAAIAREDPEVALLGNELIAEWYVDNVSDEINEMLAQSGQVTMGALATQFSLPVDFVRRAVEKRLGTTIRAAERNGALFTEAYMDKQTARVRGAFSAVSRPVLVSQVSQRFGIDDRVAESRLRELIADGVLAGKLKGREYVPDRFAAQQRDAVRAFFEANGYFELSRAAKMQIARPLEFVKREFPQAGALQLDSVVVGAAAVEQLAAAVDDAVASGAWVDARAHAPAVCGDDDVVTLLRQCPALAGRRSAAAVQLAEHYAVSRGFLAGLQERAVALAKEQAGAVVASQRTTLARSISAASAAESDGFVVVPSPSPAADSGKKRRGKKGRRRGGDDSDDDEPAPAPAPAPAPSGGKKGKRRGRKNRQQDADGDEPAAGAGAEPAAAAAAIDLTPRHVQEWVPELEDHPELAEALADEVRGDASRALRAAVAEGMSAVVHGDAADRRRMRRDLEEALDAAYAEFQMLAKGAEAVAGAGAGADGGDEELDAPVLERCGARLADLVTQLEALAADVEYASPGEAGACVDDATRERLREELPNGPAVARLWTLAFAGRRSAADLGDALRGFAQGGSVPLRRLDKKRERQMVFAHRQALGAELRAAVEPATVLALALRLVLQSAHGGVALAGGASLARVRAAPAVPPAAVELLERFAAAIDEYAALREEPESPALTRQSSAQSLEEMVEEVRALGLTKDVRSWGS